MSTKFESEKSGSEKSENSPRRSAYARLLDRAMRILAMRDHSEQEFRRKLAAPIMTKAGPEPVDASEEDVEKVVAWCYDNRYLNDARFAKQFIASRGRKGYGPARIRQELNQKGITREAGEAAMRECECDWVAIARAQADRKFGEPLPTAFAEKVKVQRFLLYRGFLMEDIQALWLNFDD
nr:recombination regulator RecX [uncultured Enterobacter sp.]